MNIEFYFDPSCPFSWITSRWLNQVQPHRDINITWQPFSLCLKNNELTTSPNDSSHAKTHRDSHRILRVIWAASQSAAADIGALYTAFGKAFHLEGASFDDQLITKVLSEVKLPSSLIDVADDLQVDAELASTIESAVKVAGSDIGVPTIIFTNENGERQGYFGPVLQALPSMEESLNLWDGLSKLATSSNFYELKRKRPTGWPDVETTR